MLRQLPLLPSTDGMTHCHICSLQPQRAATHCPPFVPANFNGLMIVGEGPGANEARLKQPFVGRSGQLLDEFLKRAGLKREETFITNATSCQPPYSAERDKTGKEIPFEERHPFAVPACKPRLLAEIEHARPRVIMALGNQALIALTGIWHRTETRKPRFVNPDGTEGACPVCAGSATLPYWEHKKKEGGCGGINYLPDGFASSIGTSIGMQQCGVCAVPTEAVLAVRRKRCPHCEGRKTISEDKHTFRAPFRISKVAGVVYRGQFAADFSKMDESAQLALPTAYVIPTYHPSGLLRQPDKKNKTQKAAGGQFLVNASLAHFRKAARLLESDAYWPFNYGIVNGDPSEPVASMDELHALLSLGTQVEITLDVEAPDKDPLKIDDITCIGFHTAVFPRAITVNTTKLKPGHPLIDYICGWLSNPAYKKAAQNGVSYDAQALFKVWGCEVQGWAFDTRIAHNAIHTDAPHDLQHISGQYTDTPPWKPPKETKAKIIHESSAEQRVYNARDNFNTALAVEALKNELVAENAQFVHDLDLAMFACAREMERVGLPIDPGRWSDWRGKATHYRDSAHDVMRQTLLEAGCHAGFVEQFNPDSPAHLLWTLYDRSGPCRLVPAKFTAPSSKFPKGQPSTDKTSLLAHKGHPVVDTLLDYRRWDKVLSTYMKEAVVFQDWRLRVQWNPLGARTGRWSTKGMNAQNWFKSILVHLRPGAVLHESDRHHPLKPNDSWLRIPGIREIVKAPPGRKIVGADLSQAELRVIAALAGETAMMQLLMRGDARTAELKAQGKHAEAKLLKYDPEYDVHSYVASIAFGTAYTGADVHTKAGLEIRDRLRDLIKRVIYGMNYGAGSETILEAIYDGGYEGPPLTEADIGKIMQAYFTAFGNIREWRERTVEEAQRTGRVSDALIGRRREYPLLIVPTTEAMNFQIQATVGSMMNMTMHELMQAKAGVDPSARLIAQIHDAIYVECDEDRAPAVAKLLENVMEQDLELVPGAGYMRFPAAAKIADDWYQAG